MINFGKLSKYMSMLLRHRPEAAGLSMDDKGYVLLDSLVQACVDYGYNITKSDIIWMIENTEKRRFELDDSGDLIRAVQGHSVDVKIEYPMLTPSKLLYEGVALLPYIFALCPRLLSLHICISHFRPQTF
jgi:putative RNA 2'-phosphotransferase